MSEIVLTTYDWVPPPPRGFVREWHGPMQPPPNPARPRFEATDPRSFGRA